MLTLNINHPSQDRQTHNPNPHRSSKIPDRDLKVEDHDPG